MQFSRIKDEKGQAILEFALVIPIFLMLVLGGIDYGYMMYKQHLLTQVTKEIARTSSITPSIDEVTTAQNSLITAYFGDENAVSVTYTPEIGSRFVGERFTIETSYTYDPITHGFGVIQKRELRSISQTIAEVNAASP